jgi:hypothetical protein
MVARPSLSKLTRKGAQDILYNMEAWKLRYSEIRYLQIINSYAKKSMIIIGGYIH